MSNAEDALAKIREILWPKADPDTQWSGDTLEDIAVVMDAAGFGRPEAGEDPAHPLADWRREVTNDETRLGYVEWLAHWRESDKDADGDVVVILLVGTEERRHVMSNYCKLIVPSSKVSEDVPYYDVHFTFTHEGIIVDTVSDGGVTGTCGLDYADLMDLLEMEDP